jgi:two-component sensor histidine kinase
LKLSEKENPGILELANDLNTQNINSVCYSIAINRLTKLINTKGNLPSELITHKNELLQNLVAENDWLLKDINHRVKNNLHMVIRMRGLIEEINGQIQFEITMGR